MMADMRQSALFDELDHESDNEPEADDDQGRRLNRERQFAFRKRHQFLAPATESPTWTSTERGRCC
jgi:hypothetical protein